MRKDKIHVSIAVNKVFSKENLIYEPTLKKMVLIELGKRGGTTKKKTVAS
ncbi:MAG: hypothetical protein ACI9GH_000208 [Candidatus Paceibacteria bacterium]|jgi:hypothetical protein